MRTIGWMGCSAMLALAACSSSSSGTTETQGDSGGADAGRGTTTNDAGQTVVQRDGSLVSDARTPTVDAKSKVDAPVSVGVDATAPVDASLGDAPVTAVDARQDAEAKEDAYTAPTHDAGIDAPHTCTTVADCAGDNCVSGKCVAPTCTDGVKDGTETDVDCGGAGCPACAATKACTANTDCTSSGCDYTGHCALAPSCTQHHGGDTCGAGEDTDLGPDPVAAMNEESCCTSIPIPGTTMVLDKYLITAGRIRAFVDRFSGNVRSFTESIPATNTNWNPAWNQYIPSTTTEVNEQLGPYPAPLTPSPYPPSDTTPDTQGLPTGNWLGQWRDGCSMGKSGTPDGARTWWTADAIGSDEAPIVYPQEFLDDKMINCIDSYMLTAFCIWDGGHLATDAEIAAAWGAGPFPWSATAPNVLIDQSTQEPSGVDAMGRNASSYIAHEFGLSADEFVAPYTYNYDPYSLDADNTIHIPAPGRFPLGAGPYGHMDLAGATYEATSIQAGSTGMEPPPAPKTVQQVDHVGTPQGGSWEIHPVISGTGTAIVYDPWMPAYWAYWAMGSRCGR